MTTANDSIQQQQQELRTSHDNEGHQYATSLSQQQQQQQMNTTQSTPSMPKGAMTNQTSGGIQTTNSFHSVSSIDSSAEMSKYFPDAQTPSFSTYGHPQETEGRNQSVVTANTVARASTNIVNAGPYASGPTTITAQQLPQSVRLPNMAQQQPTQPQGSAAQQPSGIPSYSSQIEGLSVSQAVVNDVLVDLQTKIINETVQQYNEDASTGAGLEPLSPIYIQAPQPTLVLHSDLNRLRAELNSRVRPQVVYRYPANAQPFSQAQFQSNTFQAPSFPPPSQESAQSTYYGNCQNVPFTSSDEYKTTTTTGDEYRKENEERLYNQAESTMLNDDNINGNVHSAFDPQGLSAASFDRHASPYQSSSFLNLEDQQQGKEETIFAQSNNINTEERDFTENMFSGPARPRQEVTFDLNNCILRCFEAHRERVARRRAARQARRTRRHKSAGQQPEQYQQAYYGDQYQTFSRQPTCPAFTTVEQNQWTSPGYTDVIPDSRSTYKLAHSSQGAFVPVGNHDYTNVIQTTTLPSDLHQYQTTDNINAYRSQVPFSSISTSNIDVSVPTDIQTSSADYYQYSTGNVQEPYIHSNVYDYGSHQTVPSTTDYIQQQITDQQIESKYFDYTSQVPYAPFSSTDVTFPGEIQQITADNYQQQQPYTQIIQSQEQYVQPLGTYDYTTGVTQTQAATYDYPTINQQPFDYTYASDNIQEQSSLDYTTIGATGYTSTETDYAYPTVEGHQQQTIEQLSRGQTSTNYYEQKPVPIPTTQVQGAYGQPTGTYEYTKETYQTQEPIYDYQGFDQQASEYTYKAEEIQQQEPYQYVPDTSTPYIVPEATVQETEQAQNIDESSQAFSSSVYHQEQPAPLSDYSQTYDAQVTGQGASTGTIEYTKQTYFSQEPLSDSYTTEAFIEKREQEEKAESLTVNDYIKQFESKSYPQQSRGPAKSSEEQQSTGIASATPFTLQTDVDTQITKESEEKYDLQSYTNEAVVVPEASPRVPSTSETVEEEHHLLQTTTTATTTEQIPAQEQEIDTGALVDSTFSSLPPPPSEEIDYQQESIATNASDFPAPPAIDQHDDQTVEEQQVTIVPSTQQTTTYTTSEPTKKQPCVPCPCPCRDTDDDAMEDEEIFDLQQCIAKCYAKYQELWNQDQQIPQPICDHPHPCVESNEQYEQQTITTQLPANLEQLSQQPNPLLFVRCPHQELARQYLTGTEIHYVDASTQTPSLDVAPPSTVLLHTHEETPATFDSVHYTSSVPVTDVTTDSRGQQTIEYSPPLTTQPRYVVPSISPGVPVQRYEYSKQEYDQPQQHQSVYDHILPLPSHLSANERVHQREADFSAQIIDQPRHDVSTQYDKQEQEQQRYRAHSEPAAIQQEAVVNIEPIQPVITETIEQQPRRSISIPMIYHEQPQPQVRIPSVRLIDNGRAYETDAVLRRPSPKIDARTGECIVPCPETQKYAHLPANLRPELFCIELPPANTLPPPPPPPPPAPSQRWCVKCCCNPGRTLIKKIVYKQVEEEQQQEQQSEFDYAAIIDQMATKITVRYGNTYLDDSDASFSEHYNEQLRIIDFPVYVSGENDTNLTPLVPTN